MGSRASRLSTAPFGEPGVLMMRLWPSVPDLARERGPNGFVARITSPKPGAIEHLHRCLGSEIARGKSGTTRGDDESREVKGELAQCRCH